MNNYRKHIDDFFREKLGKYAETPPADVWDSLDSRLDTLKPVLPGSSYRWLWHVGMVSVIAVLSVTVARKYMDSNTTETVTTRTTETVAPMTAAAASGLPASAAAVSPNATAIGDLPATTGDAAVPAATATGPAGSQPMTGGATATAAGRTQLAAGKPVAVVSQHVNGLNNQATTKVFASQGSSLAAKAQPAASYNSSSPVTNNSTVNADRNETAGQTASPLDQYNSGTAALNAAAKTNQDNAGGIKKNEPLADKKPVAKVTADKAPKLPLGFARWQAGVKAGYEGGVDKNAASKLAIAPYLQYNISPKFAIMVQPAVKFAKSKTTTIGNDQTFYQKNEDGKATQNGASVPVTHVIGGTIESHYETNYTFTQTHDSIVKSNTFGGGYMEYELPVLLKYNISHKTSVYGGINIIYSQTKGVTEHTYTRNGILRSLDSTIISQDLPSSPTASNVFSYNGTPYTNYHGPLYPNTQESQIRFGAMLGFSYEYSSRWLFDALIQQNPSRTDKRGGYDINIPLSSTYLRFSVGYKLTK